MTNDQLESKRRKHTGPWQVQGPELPKPFALPSAAPLQKLSNLEASKPVYGSTAADSWPTREGHMTWIQEVTAQTMLFRMIVEDKPREPESELEAEAGKEARRPFK